MQPVREQINKRSRKNYLESRVLKEDSHNEKRKQAKEEYTERKEHLVNDVSGFDLREKQDGWCAKAFCNVCSECGEVMRSYPQSGRAIVVDTKPLTVLGGSILKNCSHCLVRNVSWVISIARLSEREKEEHFNRLSTPLTKYGADLLVKSMEGYEKNRFIVVVIP